MNRLSKYKIAIIVLSLIVIFQGILLIRFLPKRQKRKMPIIKGRIAIVLDDWGYSLNNLHFLDQIRLPLTISILPNLNYSERIAYEAKSRGFELILHLPLQPMPFEKMRLEQDTITIDMDKERIRDIFIKDLNSVPGVQGVSNHMGSQVMGSPRIIEIILREMKKKNLYFLDNLVLNKLICESLSRKMKVGFAKRDIFLDNRDDPEYIKSQIYKLKLKAFKNGYAIGIGHDRRKTLEVLKEIMSELEKEGFQFVFVSELVR